MVLFVTFYWVPLHVIENRKTCLNLHPCPLSTTRMIYIFIVSCQFSLNVYISPTKLVFLLRHRQNVFESQRSIFFSTTKKWDMNLGTEGLKVPLDISKCSPDPPIDGLLGTYLCHYTLFNLDKLWVSHIWVWLGVTSDCWIKIVIENC